MHPAEQGESVIGTIYIEGTLTYEEARVGGQCAHRGNIIFIHRKVTELPQRLHNRDSYWGVNLYSDRERNFAEAWQAKYGCNWPRIAINTVHPALARLLCRYLDFEFEWSGHSGDRAMAFYDFLLRETIETFREAVMLLRKRR